MTRGWLQECAGRLAEAGGLDPAGLGVDQATVDALLDLARVAAHDSGDRTNAPLATYLVGIAVGRGAGAAVDLVPAASGEKEST